MKISHLQENLTPSSAPVPGPKFGRSDEMLESDVGTTTAGVIATNMDVKKRGGKKSIFQGIKNAGGFANSRKAGISEDAINEDDLSEENLLAKQRQEEFRFKRSTDRDIGNKPMSREIMAKEEFNGGGEYNDEIDMVQNNLHTIVRVSTHLGKALKANENMPEWVQEKIAVAKSMIVTVMDYMISQHERGNVYTQDVEEAQSASARMQKALQREKEKREYSERYAEKHFPIGKKPEPIKEPSKEVKEDDKAVDDFLARGGKIQHGKSQKGPKNPGLSYGSKHIGGSGDKMKMSRTGYGTKPAGNKPVVTAEGQDWMDDMRAVAHKIAPQDKMNQAHADRQSQQQAKQQEQVQQDIENLPDLISQYNDMEAEYESMGGKNWQYADREQNLSDEERKARGMETSMRQLANRIHTAKKASEGLAESKPDFAKMFDKKIGKHNAAVVKTKKAIGTKVSDIDPWSGKESNVKTDKEWDKQKGVAEEWSQKYKSSINCSHPKGFSQRAHCAGKKKHNESVDTQVMEMVCEDCGMCETHGDHSKDQLDELKCWSGYHRVAGTKAGFPGSCAKNKTNEEQHNESEEIAEEKCPHCNGPMFSEMIMNEKKDACYYKVKSRYKVWPSAYASGALVKCRNKGASNWGNKSESIEESIKELEESLHDWFNKEKWVRMDTKGNIKGDCAREPGEGKPKCLPQSKAHSLGKKGRASAAQRKRREDPNPERSGSAINVNTRKKLTK